MKRQQRRMELDHAVLRDRAEFGWGEEQNIGHHAEIRLEVGECALGLLARIFGEPMDGQTPFLSCRDEWVGSRSRPFRCGKNGGDLVPACDERVKHGFAKGLLTDDDDAHFLPSENVPQLVLRRSRAATPPPYRHSFMSKRPAASPSRQLRWLGAPAVPSAIAKSRRFLGQRRCGSTPSRPIGGQSRTPC